MPEASKIIDLYQKLKESEIVIPEHEPETVPVPESTPEPEAERADSAGPVQSPEHLRTACGGQAECLYFIADRWRPKNAIDGRYLWLPIDLEGDSYTVTWRDNWDLGYFDRTGSAQARP